MKEEKAEMIRKICFLLLQIIFDQYTCVSSNEHSILVPFPLFSRWYKAAVIAPTLDKPVAKSITATPTFTGS